jgi:hypothetical protein
MFTGIFAIMQAVKNREERSCLRENHETVFAPASANCQTAGEESTYQPTPRTAFLSADVA